MRSSFVSTPNVRSPSQVEKCIKDVIAPQNNNNMQKQNNICYNGKVRVPVGSTSLASLMASDVAISWLAGDIAKIIEFGCKPWNISSIMDS